MRRTLTHCLTTGLVAAALAPAGSAFAAEPAAVDTATGVEAGDGADAEAPSTSDPADADPRTTSRGGEIVVVATRIKGQVEAPQPPLVTLNEEDIAAYGAASITDLLAALSPQTGSGRGRGAGRPVVLLNGQRISGFREMRNIPPEAIRRLEILPEEVALRFGYPPDQRVINFILKDKFSARTVETEYGQPDRGGSSTTEVEGSLFRTMGPSRLNLTLSATDTTPLFESERGVQQAAGSLPGSAGARTLIADSRDLTANATWTTGLGEQGLAGSLTLNGTFTRNDTTSFFGLNGLTLDPLARRGRTETSEAGITFAKPLGTWQLTATVDASHAAGLTLIDRTNVARQTDSARSLTDSVTSLVTAVGRPLSLPAGDVTATIKGGFAWSGIVSSDTRTLLAETRLRRGNLSTGVNLGVPLTSRRNAVLPGVGDLTLNLSADLDRLSDFGTLTDWSAGLTWGVTERLGLQASYIVNQAAPGLTDLGAPLVVTPNVAIYDIARQETALVTVTTGGNRQLQRETQRDIKLGLNWQLPGLNGSNLVVEYFRNRSDNVTAGFPVFTPAIEAAFPGRVTRDAGGRLIALNRLPVTLAEQSSSRLRYGLNLSGGIGKPAPGAGGGRPGGGMMGGGPPPGGGSGPPPGAGSGGPRGGGFGGGPPGRFGNGQGRWNLSLYHTVQFENQVIVGAGGPVLDLLSGDALSGGGVARHSLEAEGGAFYRGFGLRFTGTWTAPTRVRSTGLPASSDLRFGALAKFNLRAFVDLGQQKGLVKAAPFLKNARFALMVDNVLDQRQRVTDGTGVVPIGYQPDLIDPVGRFIGVELRKQF
ncbi:TonB-dependent receptor [Novosphingobium aerophilum]|uniref:TonB-dependent receptor n=1 Tax=Novosphingobium aerophilum TaxID=2839843 RepID=UPI001FD55150|nr:TonB-dependent receptor [Novosphingobium aerophilum]